MAGQAVLQSVPRHKAPERVIPPSTSRREVTLADPPIPTLPEVVKVLNVVLPETERADVPTLPNIPADVTLILPPIPALPEVVKVERVVLPVTAKDPEE